MRFGNYRITNPLVGLVFEIFCTCRLECCCKSSWGQRRHAFFRFSNESQWSTCILALWSRKIFAEIVFYGIAYRFHLMPLLISLEKLLEKLGLDFNRFRRQHKMFLALPEINFELAYFKTMSLWLVRMPTIMVKPTLTEF